MEKAAINAFNSDSQKRRKVYTAIKIHKRLIKSGSKAEEFLKGGKKEYKYAPYF